MDLTSKTYPLPSLCYAEYMLHAMGRRQEIFVTFLSIASQTTNEYPQILAPLLS